MTTSGPFRRCTRSYIPQAECDTITPVSMLVKLGGRACRQALRQSCAGHKGELLDRVKFELQVSRTVEAGRVPASKFKVFGWNL